MSDDGKIPHHRQFVQSNLVQRMCGMMICRMLNLFSLKPKKNKESFGIFTSLDLERRGRATREINQIENCFNFNKVNFTAQKREKCKPKKHQRKQKREKSSTQYLIKFFKFLCFHLRLAIYISIILLRTALHCTKSRQIN